MAHDPVERILAFLARHVAFVTRIERYHKGTRLLADGDVARETWLGIEGGVRVFRCVDGEDRTVAFHTELQPAIPPTYGTDIPSPVSFECPRRAR